MARQFGLYKLQPGCDPRPLLLKITMTLAPFLFRWLWFPFDGSFHGALLPLCLSEFFFCRSRKRVSVDSTKYSILSLIMFAVNGYPAVPPNVCPSFRTPKCTSKGCPVLDKAKANAKLSLTHVLGNGHERKSGKPDTRAVTRTMQSVVSRFVFSGVLGAILNRSSRPGTELVRRSTGTMQSQRAVRKASQSLTTTLPECAALTGP